MDRKALPLLVSLAVLLAVSVPYLTANGAAGDETEFLGFLLNPVDGNTYLAKMYQGWEGSWRYQMAFTPDPGEGAFLFSFYLFLGHVGRITGLPLKVVFHGARILAVGFMLFSLWRFYKGNLSRQLTSPAYILAIVGSGLGWLVVPFGLFTADLWVAEGYPFLAAYANPHFPLSLGLMAWILASNSESNGALPMVFFGLLLALILPFGLVVTLGILGGQLVFHRRNSSPPGWLYRRVLWLSLGGLPIGLYDLWLVRTDPVFYGWNIQNITATPPPWELLVSFSPALVVALYTVWIELRKGKSPPPQMVVWLGIVLLLVYLPVGLQRRMLTGFFIPLAGLTVQGIDTLTKGVRRKTAFLMTLVLVLSLPTNILVLLAARQGILAQDPWLYVTKEEAGALDWIQRNTDPEALVLAGPEIGLFLPGQTGRQVIYGHPFETIEAERSRAKVLDFYQGDWDPVQTAAFISTEGVDYIFFGPRERALGKLPPGHGWAQVFLDGEVEIYSVRESAQAWTH